jgi:hypothetical protein
VNGVPIRLVKDVHGVGVRGLATRVPADLFEVLKGQGRAELRELPEKKAAEPEPEPVVIDDPGYDPGAPPLPPTCPLTVKELQKLFEEKDIEYPRGAPRAELVALYFVEGLDEEEPEK